MKISSTDCIERYSADSIERNSTDSIKSSLLLNWEIWIQVSTRTYQKIFEKSSQGSLPFSLTSTHSLTPLNIYSHIFQVQDEHRKKLVSCYVRAEIFLFSSDNRNFFSLFLEAIKIFFFRFVCAFHRPWTQHHALLLLLLLCLTFFFLPKKS